MDLSRVVSIDFETHRIEGRPKYPPEPVGVAIRAVRGRPMYLSWGHPSGNNTTREAARDVLLRLVEDEQIQFLFHNAGFELSIFFERLGLPPVPWQRVHDTVFLLFLYDPHAKKLSLKDASEELLDWPAEERDELHDWIYTHRKELIAQYGTPEFNKISKAKSGANSPAAWIAYAPGDLVGRYAIGDVQRTLALFEFLYPKILAEGMGEAYDRERRLLSILLENERSGLRVDVEGLRRDVPLYQEALEGVESRMRAYLGVSDLNFDNDRELADVFQSRGVVKPDRWVLTKKSKQLSVSKDNLPPEAFEDPLFASAFGYRNRMVTCLKMFMLPWLEQAEANGGYIHTQWNQVRGSRGGARSGRPSMTKPNLLNVSKSFEDRSDGYEHPAALELPPLPLVRVYVLPDEGHLFVHRDFSGQEVRIFAHYECGELAEAYRQDPGLDPHNWVKDAIRRAVGKELERTRVKNVTFARIYGGGQNAVYQQARCASLAEAQEIMSFHDTAIPGRKILNDEIIRIARRGEPIRTWGGRLYYVEPPSYSKEFGRVTSWDYKLINYLVQGSAADVTKEAICRWYEGGGTSMGARFLLTVYDEINISAPQHRVREDMAFLREIMDGMELDVPMRSDGKVGKSWGLLEKYD
ncbi:MAG: DNA polymerase [Pigmentiphaga sp.]|nr:DNA polymerase [Pigmentiphaga sp.]